MLTQLVDSHRQQLAENTELRRKLREGTQRIRSLEGQLLEANQKRKDVAKRIDELIGQLDHLDGQLEGGE